MWRGRLGWMATALALVLLLGTALPARAEAGEEPQVSLADAIQISVQLLELPAGLGQPEGILESEGVWSIFWRPSGIEPREMPQVRVDAMSGRLLEYRAGQQVPGVAELFHLTRAEAQKRAEHWLERLVEEGLRAQLAPMSRPPVALLNRYLEAYPSYEFRWERQAAGYPVVEEGVSLQLDGATGALRYFSLEWSDREYPKPAFTLHRSEATRLGRDRLSMELVYRQIHQPEAAAPRFQLIYRQQGGGWPLFMTQQGQTLDLAGKVVPAVDAPSYRPLKAPRQPFRPPAEPIDREGALRIARAVTGMAEAPVEATSDREPGVGPVWRLIWSSGSGALGQLMIEQSTGLVRSISDYSPDLHEPVPWKLTAAEAEEAAVAFVRAYRPDLLGRVAVQRTAAPAQEGSRLLTVNLVEMHRGIPVEPNLHTLEIDMITGRVRNFWLNPLPSGAELPEPEGLKAATEAREAFLQAMEMRLIWYTFWQENGERTEPAVVWALGATQFGAGVDAKSGAVVDWMGRPLADLLPPTDIAGHPAAREIELLWTSNVLAGSDGRFEPEHQVAAGEVIDWLAEATHDPFTPPRSSGAGPEFDRTAPVTRERFALWAVQAMGYGEIAAMPVKIPIPFADGEAVGAPYANAVAILAGLGILQPGPDGRLQPQAPLARGEAAQWIYRVAVQVRRR